MLLLRVAGISLKVKSMSYELEVLAIIASGSLTMMTFNLIEVFCDQCFFPRIEFISDQTFLFSQKMIFFQAGDDSIVRG